jgi:hypothetical protein
MPEQHYKLKVLPMGIRMPPFLFDVDMVGADVYADDLIHQREKPVDRTLRPGPYTDGVSTYTFETTPSDQSRKVTILKKGSKMVVKWADNQPPPGNALPTHVEATPLYTLTENYALYEQLQKLNLNDPNIVAQVKQACSKNTGAIPKSKKSSKK